MNQADDLKALWLKAHSAWPTAVIESRGVKLKIQALNRDQVLRAGGLTPSERECFMVAEALIEPFTVTVEEVQALREGSLPMDLEELTREIAKLSGLDKKPTEAQNAAFKSVRDESGA
jgi:hypothetical protein